MLISATGCMQPAGTVPAGLCTACHYGFTFIVMQYVTVLLLVAGGHTLLMK